MIIPQFIPKHPSQEKQGDARCCVPFSNSFISWLVSADEVLGQPEPAAILGLGVEGDGRRHRFDAFVENILAVARRVHPEVYGMPRERRVAVGVQRLTVIGGELTGAGIQNPEALVVDLVTMHETDVFRSGAEAHAGRLHAL